MHGTSIPEVRWSHDVGQGANGKPALTLRATVSGVPPGFAQLVPVRVTLKGDRTGTLYFQLKAPETSQTIELPEIPRKVVFAPRNSLLARIRQK